MNPTYPLATLFITGLAIVTISLFGTACDRDSQTSPTDDEVQGEPTVDADAGREVFEQLCITCHGPGAAPEEDLTGVTERIDFDEFDQIMDQGKGTMPAWKSVNEQHRRNIWEFLDTYAVE